MRAPAFPSPVLAAVLLLAAVSPLRAQSNVRDLMRDHEAILRAGDLNFSFIYLNKSAPEVASQVLTGEELARWTEEIEGLPEGWTLIAVRVTPYREARFDPTRITFTQRENSHPVGFMDVVDVGGMFNSTLSRGARASGFLKVSDRIDWRQGVTVGYESFRTEFLLPLKWRQKYFQFLDGLPPGGPR